MRFSMYRRSNRLYMVVSVALERKYMLMFEFSLQRHIMPRDLSFPIEKTEKTQY